MDKNSTVLAELVSSAIRGKAEYSFNTADVNWEEIYKQAAKQQVYTLVYPVIKNIASQHNIDKALMEVWKTNTFRYGIMHELNYQRLERILLDFSKHGIKPIMLKGFVYQTLYHKAQLRLMSDIDFLIHDNELEQVTKILREHGYTSMKDKKTKHVTFLHKEYICVEVHRALTDDDNIRNMDELIKEIWNSKIDFQYKNISTFTLSWEHQVI